MDIPLKLSELRNKGFQITPQRRRILQALSRDRNKHLSADEIYRLLRQQGVKVGLATVYRTLLALERLGAVTKLHIDDGPAKYEFTPLAQAHHHFVCLGCGQIVEVDGELSEEFGQLARRQNFEVVDQSIKVYGYCQDCRQKRLREVDISSKPFVAGKEV